ncbi:MAG: GDP-mannose 4,6-dehydratase [Rhodopila sp.]
MPSHAVDIRDRRALRDAVHRISPEVVIHMAAQALVRPSYADPVATVETNTMGTAYLLEAIREGKGVREVVVVTTDKCYENKEWAWPYRETDALGGHDPYSASKAGAELVAASWRSSFLRDHGVAVASACG